MASARISTPSRARSGYAGCSSAGALALLLLAALFAAPALAQERSIPADYLCFNLDPTTVESWRDQDLPRLVEDIGVTRLRVPGGPVADYWDWSRGGVREGRLNLPDPPPLSPSAFRRKDARLAEVARFMRRAKAAPVFVLNTLTSGLEPELKRLHDAERAGMKVDRIEIGNEPYVDTRNQLERFPQPRDFARLVNDWVPSIRREFPKATIALAAAVAPGPPETPRAVQWLTVMAAEGALTRADAISLHPYYAVPSDLREDAAGAEAFARVVIRDTRATATGPVLNALPAGHQVWITEHNTWETPKRVRVGGTWLQGLLAVARSLAFLEQERVSLSCLHELTGSAQWQAVAASGGDLLGRSTFLPTATGIAMAAVAPLLRQATSGRPASAPDEDGVVAWVLTGPGGSTALIVNLTARSLDLTLPGAGRGWSLAPGSPWLRPRGQISPQLVLPNRDRVTVPAFSIAGVPLATR